MCYRVLLPTLARKANHSSEVLLVIQHLIERTLPGLYRWCLFTTSLLSLCASIFPGQLKSRNVPRSIRTIASTFRLGGGTCHAYASRIVSGTSTCYIIQPQRVDPRHTTRQRDTRPLGSRRPQHVARVCQVNCVRLKRKMKQKFARAVQDLHAGWRKERIYRLPR